MSPTRLVAWDFDGVLNANVVHGRFFWADGMEADLGISPDAFARHMFARERIGQIIRGALDVREELAAFLVGVGSDHTADTVLAYWLERDSHLDAEVLGWLRAAPGRQVVATNNERNRARYMREEMGLGALVERVFASGEIGHAKPDAGFFEAIEAWAGLAPEEMLLIDDSARNTDAAAARGWRVFPFTSESRAALPGVLGLA